MTFYCEFSGFLHSWWFNSKCLLSVSHNNSNSKWLGQNEIPIYWFCAEWGWSTYHDPPQPPRASTLRATFICFGLPPTTSDFHFILFLDGRRVIDWFRSSISEKKHADLQIDQIFFVLLMFGVSTRAGTVVCLTAIIQDQGPNVVCKILADYKLELCRPKWTNYFDPPDSPHFWKNTAAKRFLFPLRRDSVLG